MKNLSWKILVALAPMASGCLHTSPPPTLDPNGLSPLGVRAEIIARNNMQYGGELLALTETSFVLLATDRVLVFPFARAGAGDFRAIGVGTYGAPSVTNREQLRLSSRFPYGIPESAMTAILRSKGQTAPDTVKLNP